MDVPAAAAGPWIALGAVLGILLLLAVAAVVVGLRSRARPSVPAAAGQSGDEPRDDLAGFLAHPPGSPGAPEDDGDGWAALSSPALPDARHEPAPLPAAPGSRPGPVLAGLAVATLVLVGTAAALAASARSPEPSPAAAPGTPSTSAPAASTAPDPDGVDARLAFGGVVLEEHAVGVTVAYPELELTSDGAGTVARLRLPTANCLAAAAPPAPGDPSCRAARTEYAELSTPGLTVVRDGDELSVSGRFATSLRPPGGPEEPTGRSHELAVTVSPAGAERDGWVPAEGRLRWDDQRAPTRADGPPSVLRPLG